MKSMDEMRESATETARHLASTAKKAGYAAVGAPRVAGRRIAELAGKMGQGATREFEAWVAEGEALTEQLRDRNVVDELKERVDIDQLQDRVEKLRDQLEDVLANWRDTFMPHDEAAPPAKAEPAKKPAARKPATKKAAAKPAAKTPAAKKTAAKKTTALS